MKTTIKTLLLFLFLLGIADAADKTKDKTPEKPTGREVGHSRSDQIDKDGRAFKDKEWENRWNKPRPFDPVKTSPAPKTPPRTNAAVVISSRRNADGSTVTNSFILAKPEKGK